MSMRSGVWVFILLLAAGGLIVFFAALNLRRPFASAESTVLVFDVPSEMEESDVPFHPLSLKWMRPDRLTVYQAVQGLRHAAEDERVAALVLHIDGVNWGWAKLAEVRDAIQGFRESGKPVYASITSGGDAEYFLASAADVIAVPPGSLLLLDGLTASALFLKDTFVKLGVRPNFANAGRYKSAVEQYTRGGMSPETREALDAVLADDFRLLVDSLATARRVSPDSIRHLLDRGPHSAEGALSLGLVDALLHEADVDSLAVRSEGLRTSSISFARYVDDLSAPPGGPRIAMVAASGTIVPGRSRFLPDEGFTLGSESVIEILREVRTRRAIKAVVLRIDSPGGVMTASDEIWREVQKCGEVKPVIVSMSDLAASGAYYVAVAADRIVAQPSSLTGSIGVYGGKLNLLGLYRKLGINVETLSRGRHADMMSPFTDFTEEERLVYQGYLDEGYQMFLQRVSDGRRLALDHVDSVSQGRIWSGLEARNRGLVDELGGIETAFRLALVEAGYAADAKYSVEQFPKIERRFFERFLGDWLDWGHLESFTTSARLPPVIRAWLAVARFPTGAALALMPYSIEIR